MSLQPVVEKVPAFTPGRLAACVGLAGALFGAGLQEQALFALLARGWQVVMEALGLSGLLTHVQQGTSTEITKHSIPAMLTGSLCYVAVCLLLLHLLLRSRERTWWAVKVYLALGGACALLLILGKLGGNQVLLYKLARRLINIIVSPLPIMLLVPLLWPGRGVRS